MHNMKLRKVYMWKLTPRRGRGKVRYKYGTMDGRKRDSLDLLKRYPDINKRYHVEAWPSTRLPEREAYLLAGNLYDMYPPAHDNPNIEGMLTARTLTTSEAITVGNEIKESGQQFWKQFNKKKRWSRRRPNWV